MYDEINQKGLDSLARLWNNYKTDYKPLVDFAKANNLRFTATNIPRRYASMVYRSGFSALDTLRNLEKSWMAPLPMAFDASLPTYQSILKMMGPHGSPKLVMSQATKDATMAHFILKHYTIGSLFLELLNRFAQTPNHSSFMLFCPLIKSFLYPPLDQEAVLSCLSRFMVCPVFHQPSLH
mgnify:CR=1 FL=1